MSIFRTPQVILFSDDLPRAAAFYARLGFAETFRTPADGEPIHIDLALDGYKIGIAAVTSSRDDHGLEPIAQGQRAAVILWTDDTNAAFDRPDRGRGARPRRSPCVAGPAVDRVDGRPGRQPDPDRPVHGWVTVIVWRHDRLSIEAGIDDIARVGFHNPAVSRYVMRDIWCSQR
ncbi:MAG: VOC family protein [Micromonosporaceae bacterium]